MLTPRPLKKVVCRIPGKYCSAFVVLFFFNVQIATGAGCERKAEVVKTNCSDVALKSPNLSCVEWQR